MLLYLAERVVYDNKLWDKIPIENIREEAKNIWKIFIEAIINRAVLFIKTNYKYLKNYIKHPYFHMTSEYYEEFKETILELIDNNYEPNSVILFTCYKNYFNFYTKYFGLIRNGLYIQYMLFALILSNRITELYDLFMKDDSNMDNENVYDLSFPRVYFSLLEYFEERKYIIDLLKDKKFGPKYNDLCMIDMTQVRLTHDNNAKYRYIGCYESNTFDYNIYYSEKEILEYNNIIMLYQLLINKKYDLANQWMKLNYPDDFNIIYNIDIRYIEDIKDIKDMDIIYNKIANRDIMIVPSNRFKKINDGYSIQHLYILTQLIGFRIVLLPTGNGLFKFKIIKDHDYKFDINKNFIIDLVLSLLFKMQFSSRDLAKLTKYYPFLEKIFGDIETYMYKYTGRIKMCFNFMVEYPTLIKSLNVSSKLERGLEILIATAKYDNPYYSLENLTDELIKKFDYNRISLITEMLDFQSINITRPAEWDNIANYYWERAKYYIGREADFIYYELQGHWLDEFSTNKNEKLISEN